VRRGDALPGRAGVGHLLRDAAGLPPLGRARRALRQERIRDASGQTLPVVRALCRPGARAKGAHEPHRPRLGPAPGLSGRGLHRALPHRRDGKPGQGPLLRAVSPRGGKYRPRNADSAQFPLRRLPRLRGLLDGGLPCQAESPGPREGRGQARAFGPVRRGGFVGHGGAFIRGDPGAAGLPVHRPRLHAKGRDRLHQGSVFQAGLELRPRGRLRALPQAPAGRDGSGAKAQNHRRGVRAHV